MKSPPFLEGRQFLLFLISFPGQRTPSEMGSTLKVKEFAPPGANIFFLRVDPHWEGGKNESTRVTSPESVPIHLTDSTTKQFNLSDDQHMICTNTGVTTFYKENVENYQIRSCTE